MDGASGLCCSVPLCPQLERARTCRTLPIKCAGTGAKRDSIQRCERSRSIQIHNVLASCRRRRHRRHRRVPGARCAMLAEIAPPSALSERRDSHSRHVGRFTFLAGSPVRIRTVREWFIIIIIVNIFCPHAHTHMHTHFACELRSLLRA